MFGLKCSVIKVLPVHRWKCIWV